MLRPAISSRAADVFGVPTRFAAARTFTNAIQTRNTAIARIQSRTAPALLLFARGESLARTSRRTEVDQAIRQPETDRVLAGSLHLILACPQGITLLEIDPVEPLTAREARRSPAGPRVPGEPLALALAPSGPPHVNSMPARISFETMRMRGPDCRSLAVAQPGRRLARASAAMDVRTSIAIVVRSSITTAETWCEPVDSKKPATPQIEQAQRVAHGPRNEFPGQQIIPGDVRAAYQRRPGREAPHQLDLLV